MVKVISQNGIPWLIEWFRLEENDETGWFDMIAMARLSVEQTQIVKIASYKFWKQAIVVFGKLDWQASDLMHYRSASKVFQMPEPIVDEQVCLQVYGSLY